MRTLITNGTIVTADGSYQADLLVDGETIAQIGRGLAATGITADRTIDAKGKWVIPGGIDVHTHMKLPFGGTFAKDDFFTGTRAAAFGGTTTIVDFAIQYKGQTLHHAWETWMKKAEGKANRTDVAQLELNERTEEIARMLAGAEVTAEARAAASSLLAAPEPAAIKAKPKKARAAS